MDTDDPTFYIKSGNAEFGNRQKSVFDLLTLAEKGTTLQSNIEASIVEVPTRSALKRRRFETRNFKGQESLFKRPEDPPPFVRRCIRTPDFRRNPHRWTKYTLGDVSSEEMSDKTNTLTALAFLKDLHTNKQTDEVEEKMDVEEAASSKSIVKFKPPKVNKSPKACFGEITEPIQETALSDKPTFKSSKLIMPEYVVGEKMKKKEKKKIAHKERTKEIKLDHLQEEEEDE